MGLFSSQKKCAICNGNISSIKKYKVKDDNYLCGICGDKCGFSIDTCTQNYSTEFLRQLITSIDNGGKQFLGKILFDDKLQQLWNITKPTQKINYCDIVDYKLIDDTNVVSENGLGRAIVGGALFGTIGAILGGLATNSSTVCNQLSLKLTVRGEFEPAIYINFLDTSTESGSLRHKYIIETIQSCISKLDLIIAEHKILSNTPKISVADEILKFKKLLDDGIITQDEFSAKKKILLEI